MNGAPAAWHELLAILDAAQPTSLLLMGNHSDTPLAAWLSQHPDAVCIQPSPADLLHPPATRVPLGLICNTLETLETNAGRALISALRDLHCEVLYVVVPLDCSDIAHKSTWQTRDLLALGLSQIKRWEEHGTVYGLFRHNIDDYKSTPQWLNNRDWANPEMWDKFRW